MVFINFKLNLNNMWVIVLIVVVAIIFWWLSVKDHEKMVDTMSNISEKNQEISDAFKGKK